MRHAACTWERGSDMGLAERAGRANRTRVAPRSQPRNRPTEHTRSPSRMDHARAFTFTMGHAHVYFDI